MTLSVQNSSVRTFGVKDLDANDGNPISRIVSEYGIVYVTSITRDGCSGCEEQKPLFRDLANRLSNEHRDKFSFNNIHVRYSEQDPKESASAKRIFGHGSYPTYMIHIKSQYGPLEHYRAAYPRMEDLDHQAVNAIELAAFYRQRASKE